MEYNISELKTAIRVAMDQNNSSTALSALGDVDTLKLEEIIESKIPIAARIVESIAPAMLLDSGKAFGEVIGWDSQPGYGSGHIQLPDDFLRLVTFQMSDWDYAVTEAISETDPLYIQQRSRYPGIKGNPQRPVVAIVQQPIGQVLEFYSCETGDQAFIKRARYIPVPRVRNHMIDICEKLKDAIVFYAAYLVALEIGNGDLATAMDNTVKMLLGIPSE